MIIRYTNGKSFEAVLLSRTDTTMRVAMRGSEDVQELNSLFGLWISEDCEPVQVTFSWSGQAAAEDLTEADCVCSRDLAAHLIHLLYSGDDAPEAASAPFARPTAAGASVLHLV
jgi:hypothetical protein